MSALIYSLSNAADLIDSSMLCVLAGKGATVGMSSEVVIFAARGRMVRERCLGGGAVFPVPAVNGR